jgi:glycosyltransferase involved in cell wall biosynthesis
MKTIPPSSNSLTVIVPLYNEADSLPDFLQELVNLCQEKHWHLTLVDDGSTDATAQLLIRYENQPNVMIIHHKLNRGYGGALKSGFASSTTTHIITMDGDGQHCLADIEPVFNFAVEKDADLVVGDRGKRSILNSFRELGKWIIRNFTKVLMPLPIHDLNSGFKLYRTEPALRYATICPNSMAFSDVIALTFISQRDLVLEFPITVLARKKGKSSIRFSTALDTVMEIINIALMFNPLRVFLPISILCILVGVGWGMPFLILGHGVSVGSMLAIVIGLLFFALGLIATQLAAIRMGLLNKEN